MDLLPGFEMLAGKCVLCNTDATAGTASGLRPDKEDAVAVNL